MNCITRCLILFCSDKNSENTTLKKLLKKLWVIFFSANEIEQHSDNVEQSKKFSRISSSNREGYGGIKKYSERSEQTPIGKIQKKNKNSVLFFLQNEKKNKNQLD